MERISRDQVRRLAWLAKIDLSIDEEDALSKQVGDILRYFKVMDKVDTEKTEPYRARSFQNVFRPDKPEKSNPDEILKLAPVKKGRYIRAPRIV